jgi:hypothetical protein
MARTQDKRTTSILIRLGWVGVAAAWLVGSLPAQGAAAAPAAAGGAKLIYAGWFGNTIPTPAFIAANKSFLETQPFDGLVAYLRNDATDTNATTKVMSGSPISADAIASVLAPMKGLAWTNLTRNFGLVVGTSPPDAFDDWSVVVQNFANCAQALRDAGLVGICFDNEQYFSPWGNYPAGAKYYATKTLDDYRAQMRLRGQQVMAAMVAVFPNIAVITLHGPYISEPSAPAALQFPQWQSGNWLLGPYYAGFMEGVGGSPALCIDGGELYTLRTPSDFLNSYNWRKFAEPSDAVNSPFIPPALRAVWSGRISISFGVYDQPFGGASMDAGIVKTTLTNALAQADHYVWFYTEGVTLLLPPSAGNPSGAWVDAVRQAIASVPSGPPPLPVPDAVAASPVSQTQVDLAWTSSGSGVTGFKIERKTGAGGAYSQIALASSSARSYSDTSVSAGTTYVYRVRSTSGASDSGYSGEATVTTPAAVTSPPPPPDPAPTPPPSGGDGGTSGGSSGSSSGGSSGGGGGGGCGLLGLEGVMIGLASAGRRILSRIRRTE